MPPLVLAAEADVERRNAEVLEERRVSRSPIRARRCAQSGARCGPSAFSSGFALVDRARLRRFQTLTLRFRIGDVARDVVHEVLERVRASAVEKAAAVAVGVDVDDRFLLQLGGVRLDPLGRSEQRRLLAVPRA